MGGGYKWWGGGGQGRGDPLLPSNQGVLCSSHISQMGQDFSPADAEVKVPSVQNPELTNVLPVKPKVGQNIAMHASPLPGMIYLS